MYLNLESQFRRIRLALDSKHVGRGRAGGVYEYKLGVISHPRHFHFSSEGGTAAQKRI